MAGMDEDEQLKETCRKKIGEIQKDAAHARTTGMLSEANFVEMVLRIEAEQVRPDGFTLTAAEPDDGRIVFELRKVGTSATCAAFEFLPKTGELRLGGLGTGNDGSKRVRAPGRAGRAGRRSSRPPARRPVDRVRSGHPSPA
jgi:hypothetical protein